MKFNEEHQKIATDALRSGLKGATIAIAWGVISGFAMVSIPVTILWGWVAVDTKSESSPELILLFAVAGAIIGGVIGGVRQYKKIQTIKRIFNERLNGQ